MAASTIFSALVDLSMLRVGEIVVVMYTTDDGTGAEQGHGHLSGQLSRFSAGNSGRRLKQQTAGSADEAYERARWP